MTNAEARFNKSLRPRKPEGSLGQTAQDIHLDSHTAPERVAFRQGGPLPRVPLYTVLTFACSDLVSKGLGSRMIKSWLK